MEEEIKARISGGEKRQRHILREAHRRQFIIVCIDLVEVGNKSIDEGITGGGWLSIDEGITGGGWLSIDEGATGGGWLSIDEGGGGWLRWLECGVELRRTEKVWRSHGNRNGKTSRIDCGKTFRIKVLDFEMNSDEDEFR